MEVYGTLRSHQSALGIDKSASASASASAVVGPVTWGAHDAPVTDLNMVLKVSVRVRSPTVLSRFLWLSHRVEHSLRSASVSASRRVGPSLTPLACQAAMNDRFTVFVVGSTYGVGLGRRNTVTANGASLRQSRRFQVAERCWTARHRPHRRQLVPDRNRSAWTAIGN
jgi:hypothetical protein